MVTKIFKTPNKFSNRNFQTLTVSQKCLCEIGNSELIASARGISTPGSLPNGQVLKVVGQRLYKGHPV